MEENNQPNQTEKPKMEAPVEEAVVSNEVVEVTSEGKDLPAPEGQPVTAAPEPTPAIQSLGAEMSAMTSAAEEPKPQKRLRSLPFPWFRVSLIGLLIPLLTISLAIGVYYLIEVTIGFDMFKTYSWVLWSVLGICGLIVLLPATWLLAKMQVGRAFFLAAGTLICSIGAIALMSTVFAAPFSTAWGWYSVISQWPDWMLIGLPFIGAVTMIFLTLIVHSLGRFIPKFFTIVVFIVVVAAPWVGNYFAS
jgi:hypothetical protein